jgi:hypothetical protein
MKVRISVPVVLTTLALSGCGSGSTAATWPPKLPGPSAAEDATVRHAAEVKQAREEAKRSRDEVAARKKAAAEAKHKAAKRAALKRKLHAYEQSPEYKKIQAEMHQGEEYEQAHKGEEEAHEQEYERRARGELTPEEQKDQEAREKEAHDESEVIREGERLKEEGK